MKTTTANEPSQAQKIIRLLDYAAFAILTLFLVGIIASSGMANVQTDAIDYYAIVQKLTPDSGTPIVRNLHFVAQRSPGYPLLCLIPYYLISAVVEPFVAEETIVAPPTSPAAPTQTPTERMLLPGEPVLFREIFFKNFYIESQDSWFEWKIIAAMLVTSYAFLFIGLVFAVKTLALQKDAFLGASLVPLTLFTSTVFMHNIVNTPAYATLTAFGLSSLFGYFFVQGSLGKQSRPQRLAGLFMGLLVLTRLETVVIAATVLVSLGVIREFNFVKNYILGGGTAVIILLLYNFSQFGTPFHLAILSGDVNLISFDWGYLYANLVNPQSGILFWSALASLGLLGLLLDGPRHFKILGIASLALLALVLVRVPIMYTCVGEGPKIIGGLPITCPRNVTEMATLIRFDANRYITVLFPFAFLGLRKLVVSIPGLLSKPHNAFGRK
ncbi:MAG: hypothetical protein IT327_07225 [Anaerolineae bacterium]|nr:hypothetical protein [Anaerolineae bacterium]